MGRGLITFEARTLSNLSDREQEITKSSNLHASIILFSSTTVPSALEQQQQEKWLQHRPHWPTTPLTETLSARHCCCVPGNTSEEPSTLLLLDPVRRHLSCSHLQLPCPPLQTWMSSGLMGRCYCEISSGGPLRLREHGDWNEN